MNAQAPEQQPSTSKVLTEFGPLIVFFAVNAWKGIFWATGAFMIALAVAIVSTKLRGAKVPTMTLFTGVLVLVFGGLTLWLKDERFIKLKVTIVNGIFAGLLFFGMLTGRNLLQAVLGHAFNLDDVGWKKLTARYIAFFLALAAINEVIWRNVSTDTWVAFKTFGLIGLMLVFTIMQVPLLQKHQIDGDDSGDATPPASGPASSEGDG